MKVSVSSAPAAEVVLLQRRNPEFSCRGWMTGYNDLLTQRSRLNKPYLCCHSVHFLERCHFESWITLSTATPVGSSLWVAPSGKPLNPDWVFLQGQSEWCFTDYLRNQLVMESNILARTAHYMWWNTNADVCGNSDDTVLTVSSCRTLTKEWFWSHDEQQGQLLHNIMESFLFLLKIIKQLHTPHQLGSLLWSHELGDSTF